MSDQTIIEYKNRQGSHIIAALDNKGIWHVLCLTTAGHVHQFKWTKEELEFDAGRNLGGILGAPNANPYRSQA